MGGGGLQVVDLSFYQTHYGITTLDAAFEKFVGALQNYFDADYYVAWDAIYQRVDDIRPELNILSSLCCAHDKLSVARNLLTRYPEVLKAFPLLMARRGTVQLMDPRNEGKVTDYTFPKRARKLSPDEIEHYLRFLCDSRVIELLDHIKSVPDYVTGVEVGMDTNGRKNRGGKCGVKAIRPFVEDALTKLPQLESKEEATFDYLSTQGCSLPEHYRGERWDWAFWLRDAPRRLVVMEINHYGANGSKPKAIVRDYTGRDKELTAADVGFIWVTDGLGWGKKSKPLREAFESIRFLVNVGLAKDGQLEWALRRAIRSSLKGRRDYAA